MKLISSKLCIPKLSKEIYLFFYFIFAIIFFPFCIINSNVNFLLMFSIIECLLFSIYLYKDSETISFVFLFWVISHFFNLSILFIPEDNEFGVLLPYVAHNLNENNVFITVIYVFLCHFLFSLGCVVSNICRYNEVSLKRKKMHNIIKVAKILIILGIIPKLFLVYKYFTLFLSGSYYKVVKYTPNGIFYFISTLVDVGLLLLISCNLSLKNKSKYIILYIFFQVFFAIVGKRGTAISNIIALVIVICANKKINLAKLFKIFLVSLLVLFLVVLISQYRGLSSDSREDFFSDFFSKSNILLYIIYFACSEFGSAFLTICYSIMYLSNVHSWGINYFIGAFTIIPTTSSISQLVNKISRYKNLFPMKTNIGGSYIGETFYSFSWLGIFVFLVYGFCINFISKIVINEMKAKYKSYAFFIIPMLSYLTWWIRDYFSPLWRPFFWTVLLILIIDFFLKYSKEVSYK